MAKLKLHKCPFTKWRNIRERRFCTWSQLTLDRGYQENYPLWTMGPATLATALMVTALSSGQWTHPKGGKMERLPHYPW